MSSQRFTRLLGVSNWPIPRSDVEEAATERAIRTTDEAGAYTRENGVNRKLFALFGVIREPSKLHFRSLQYRIAAKSFLTWAKGQTNGPEGVVGMVVERDS